MRRSHPNPRTRKSYNIRGNVWDELGVFEPALAGYDEAIRTENPLFRLVPNRFGKATRCLHSSNNTAPIPEVRFKFNPDGIRDGGAHQLRVSGGHSFPSSRTP